MARKWAGTAGLREESTSPDNRARTGLDQASESGIRVRYPSQASESVIVRVRHPTEASESSKAFHTHRAQKDSYETRPRSDSGFSGDPAPAAHAAAG